MSKEGAAVGRDEVWIEKYRPATLDEMVGQEAITSRLSGYVEQEDLPHLLFSGPAGVGKCVTGDTPILTNHGIERMEDLVGNIEGFSDPDENLEVLALDGKEFDFVEPSHLFSKQAEDLLKINTRDGAHLTVTSEHQLLVISNEGFEWKPAEKLSCGDRIVRPLSMPIPGGNGELDWLSAMDGKRTLVHVTRELAEEHQIPAEENFVGGKKAVLSGIRNGQDDSEIADGSGVKEKTVQEYRRELSDVDLDDPSTICSLGFLRELDVSRDRLKKHITGIQYVSPFNKRSEPITPPWSVTPELATFVGLAISEGTLQRHGIIFTNTDEKLLSQFDETANKVFDVDPSVREDDGVSHRAIYNRTVTHLLESCFDIYEDETSSGGISSSLVLAGAESQSRFLRAVFDAEAYISTNGIIELTQKDADHITLLSYLLSGFGIPSRRKTKLKSATNGSGQEREYHELYISGNQALRRFQTEIGFTDPEKGNRLAEITTREGNPNHDTLPAQAAIDDLCEKLCLPKTEFVSDSLNPSNPGRENHLRDIDRVLSAANKRIEMAQRVLERLSRLEDAINGVSTIPAAWVSNRRSFVPLDTRQELTKETGIRSDRLLEYADGRRTPEARRAGKLLARQDIVQGDVGTAHIQDVLNTAIKSLGVPFEEIARGTDLRGTDVINLLNNDDHDLASLTRFKTVSERLRTEAAKFLDEDVLKALVTLETIASADVYLDEVQAIDREIESQRVYDITVPNTRNYVGGAVPTVMHNTTAAVAIAHELYGEDWQNNFLELNASDERGIDVIRDRIKSFARSSFGGSNYRIIFLDESDSLTDEAQAALRRTMEQFSHNTRFILNCNYSSQIIDPIQSRCAVFRFSPIPDEAVAERIREIAETEGIELADDGVDALVYAADGDMRKAINALQAAAVLGDTVDEEAVYTITSTARPEDIQAMVEAALDGDFTGARTVLDELLTDQGLAGGDVIDQLHRAVWDFDLDDEAAVRLLDRIGEADYRIAEGANERLQLEALLAAVALHGED